jgi:hypothetical protein
MIKGVRTLKYGEIIPILGEIYREGETGTLLLQSGPSAKYLYFQSGQVIFAASNSPEDKFTQILLEEGKLKEEQLEMAMQKKGSKTIAKTLTELGFISSPDLLDSLIMQVYRVASSVIVWTDGNASFKPDVLPQGVAKLPMSTQRLILDLGLSIENRQWALQVVGGMDKVIAINKAEMDVTLGLPLTPEEEKDIRLCDGKRSIEEIAALSGSDPFKTVKLLIGLHYLGLAHAKRLIEPASDAAKLTEHPQDEKHLDLSFLEQALPSQQGKAAKFESVVPPKEEQFIPQKIEGETEDKDRHVAERTKEEPQEAIQTPLFQPTFLPLDDAGLGESEFGREPKVILPPPNPMPERSRKGLKILITTGAIVLVIAAIVVSCFIFLQERDTGVPPAVMPPAVAKKQPPSPKQQLASVPSAGAKKEAAKTEAVEPQKLPASQAPAPEKTARIEAPQTAVPKPKEIPKTEEKKPEPMPPKKVESEVAKEEPSGKDPYESLKAGDYSSAAIGFKRNYSSKKGGYTIALMIACETETVQKSFAEAGGSREFIIFPHNFKGRNCYRVVWGYYSSRQDADAAFSKLPGLFKDSGARIVPFESMKP